MLGHLKNAGIEEAVIDGESAMESIQTFETETEPELQPLAVLHGKKDIYDIPDEDSLGYETDTTNASVTDEPDENPADLEEDEDTTQFPTEMYTHVGYNSDGPPPSFARDIYPEKDMDVDFGAATATKNNQAKNVALMDRNVIAGLVTKDALVWQPIHESHVKKVKDYTNNGIRGAFKECRDNIDYLEYFIQMFPMDWREC